MSFYLDSKIYIIKSNKIVVILQAQGLFKTTHTERIIKTNWHYYNFSMWNISVEIKMLSNAFSLYFQPNKNKQNSKTKLFNNSEF